MHLQQEGAIVIQKYVRGWLARRLLVQLRKEDKERKLMEVIRNME